MFRLVRTRTEAKGWFGGDANHGHGNKMKLSRKRKNAKIYGAQMTQFNRWFGGDANHGHRKLSKIEVSA